VKTGKWSNGDQWVKETAGASEVSEKVMSGLDQEQGRSQGVGPGTPNPIPLKIITDKTCIGVRTRHALRVRLIELYECLE